MKIFLKKKIKNTLLERVLIYVKLSVTLLKGIKDKGVMTVLVNDKTPYGK